MDEQVFYRVYFKDQTTYKGGDFRFSSYWNEMPDKQIISIEYYFPNTTLLLSGFESYNHRIERFSTLNTNFRYKNAISRLILMGRYNAKIIIICFNLLKKETTKKEFPAYTQEEYLNIKKIIQKEIDTLKNINDIETNQIIKEKEDYLRDLKEAIQSTGWKQGIKSDLLPIIKTITPEK